MRRICYSKSYVHSFVSFLTSNLMPNMVENVFVRMITLVLFFHTETLGAVNDATVQTDHWLAASSFVKKSEDLDEGVLFGEPQDLLFLGRVWSSQPFPLFQSH